MVHQDMHVEKTIQRIILAYSAGALPFFGMANACFVVPTFLRNLIETAWKQDEDDHNGIERERDRNQ
jgi:hypothetical protein